MKRVEIIDESTLEGWAKIKVEGDDVYEVKTSYYTGDYKVSKEGVEIPSQEFDKLLKKYGYKIRAVFSEYGDAVDLLEIRTLEGVHGVYKDSEGNRWYSDWD